jgi:hypothetical protein
MSVYPHHIVFLSSLNYSIAYSTSDDGTVVVVRVDDESEGLIVVCGGMRGIPYVNVVPFLCVRLPSCVISRVFPERSHGSYDQ